MTLGDEEQEILDRIRSDQANRYNDGLAHPSSPCNEVYKDLEELLSIFDPEYPYRYKEEEVDEN